MYTINKQQRELIKIYLFLFAMIYILINWNTVSWIFNYREMSGLFSDFFNPYQNSPLLANANASERNLFTVNNVASQEIFPYSEKENSLEIPSIGVTAPVVIGQSTDQAFLAKDLDKGVVYYPGSVAPGANGQIIILGHSAPPNWPKVKYDWVFSDINNLNAGDTIVIYFNNRQYTYAVTGKDIIDKGQEVPVTGLGGNRLSIVSCWPPGKDYKRIAVQAQLIK